MQPPPQHFLPIVSDYLEHEFQEQLWCQATPAQRNGCGNVYRCCCCWSCSFRRKTCYCDGDGVVVGLKTMLQTVRTPTLCIPDTSDRPGYFLFNLLNLATLLLSYAVRLVLLTFVLLSSLPCYVYDATFILTLGYPLFTNTYVS